MELKIERLDHHGRGIGHLNGKVVFVHGAIPGDVVEVNITRDLDKYMEASIALFKEKSKERVKSKCPYFGVCGGCHIRHLSYENTLEFKKNKVQEILKKYAGLEVDIRIVKNKQKDFYRNKIELQVVDGVYGFFKTGSHEIVEIDRCMNAEEPINTILRSTNLLNITNGLVVIKANYNGEIILNIKSENEVKIDIEALRDKCKLVGIIWNDKPIFGADHFIEIVDGSLFKETYNSFFQVNRYINEELFKLLKENVDAGSTVVDMCSGVGTLSICASKTARKVYGIEIVENAVRDALVNARMNKVDNVDFLLGDAYKRLSKIEEKYDTIIVDPPRSGLTREALETMLDTIPQKIIYISCDPVTLSRDLSVLKNKYDIEKFYILDMFSYTYHVESMVVLIKKNN